MQGHKSQEAGEKRMHFGFYTTTTAANRGNMANWRGGENVITDHSYF